MYRSILVPVDGSALADRALVVATAIADRTGCDLHFVHVFRQFVVDELPLYGLSGEAARASAENYVLATAHRKQRAVRGKVDGVLVEGSTADAIVERAAKVGADLIVMGSHGRTGVSRALLGSVADDVIRSAPVPVLMVRDEPGAPENAAPKLDRVLVPLDGSALAESVIPHAIAFARTSDAHIHLLRVEERAEDLRRSVWGIADVEPDDLVLRLERADRYLDSVISRFRAEWTPATVSAEARGAHRVGEAIAHIAIERGCDLIAMSTHGRGASRLLIGSVADKVIHGTQCSVLLLRGRGRSTMRHDPPTS